MAEGFVNALGGHRFEADSAGTEARGIHPLAIQAMAEEGIDIAMHESKTVDRFLNQPFDIVITVCDDAAEACPAFPGARKRMHWSFPDPSKLTGTDEERYAAFVRVRDAIRARIEQELLAS
jgi:arsenate reductase